MQTAAASGRSPLADPAAASRLVDEELDADLDLPRVAGRRRLAEVERDLLGHDAVGRSEVARVVGDRDRVQGRVDEDEVLLVGDVEDLEAQLGVEEAAEPEVLEEHQIELEELRTLAVAAARHLVRAAELIADQRVGPRVEPLLAAAASRLAGLAGHAQGPLIAEVA